MSADSPTAFPRTFVVEASGRERVDAFLAGQMPEHSRATLRRAIDAGHVTVDGSTVKPSHRLTAGDVVTVQQLSPPPPGPQPEAIALDLLYEDDDMVVVNKPAGMIVHPARGHWAGTLASALAHHFGEQLSTTGGATRPGIVHRLDRDTSGVIVVAKHDRAHAALAAQFKDRTTEKEYLAIVLGVPDRDADVIDQPIGPHPHSREKMAIRVGHPKSREAVTKYEVVERFQRHTLVRCFPRTGRTHQIRVHMAHVGHAVLCDKLYGGASTALLHQLIPDKAAQERRVTGDIMEHEPLLTRQALHAYRLTIAHPTGGHRMTFEVEPPSDIQAALDSLRA